VEHDFGLERDNQAGGSLLHQAKSFGQCAPVQKPISKRFPFVMKLESLKDLYIHELKDLHSAEKQITKALPKMAKVAGNDELATAFREHLDQTHEHIWRLEKILGRHGESLRAPKCKGMEGLLKEGAEMIETDAEDEVRDAGLISTAQRVEHYEIAAYGCARTYAELLGDEEGVCLLKATLSDEKATDEKLTDLARSINVDAEVAVA
jgi:ferritin-like metal-binding protein YciE